MEDQRTKGRKKRKIKYMQKETLKINFLLQYRNVSINIMFIYKTFRAGS